jgi:hypothetical protein
MGIDLVDTENGVFISHVRPDSPAHKAGLQQVSLLPCIHTRLLNVLHPCAVACTGSRGERRFGLASRPRVSRACKSLPLMAMT